MTVKEIVQYCRELSEEEEKQSFKTMSMIYGTRVVVMDCVR